MKTPSPTRWLVLLGLLAVALGGTIVALVIFLRPAPSATRPVAALEAAVAESPRDQPPLSFTEADFRLAQVLKSNPVQKVLSGNRGSVDYTQELARAEVIVGHAFRFQRQSGGAVFLMTGPGTFEFSINSGLWYKHTNTTPALNEALLQGQIDTMVIKYHVPIESLKIHRLNGRGSGGAQ
jgi:hypothetical protein